MAYKDKIKEKKYEEKRRKNPKRILWTKLWKRGNKRFYYGKYKENSKNRGIEFLLSFEEFNYITSSSCVYCRNEKSGIDRIDNDKGYIYYNCVPCCKTCNFMKGKLSKSEFINQCKLVAKSN